MIGVCFISFASRSLFDPGLPPEHGGAELQSYLLAHALAADPAFSVHYLLRQRNPRVRYEGPVHLHYLNLIGSGVPVLSRYTNQRRWARALASTRCDVFIQSAAGGITAQIQRWCARNGRTFLYRLACDADVDGSILPDVRERKLYLEGMQAADVLISRNRYQKSELLRRYGKDSVIIPNAFPMPAALPSVPKEHVLWVASAQGLKQPWVFLDLARAFPHERFFMVMPTNVADLFERIRSEAATIPNLEFSEGVPFDEIQGLFDRAKVFVNTSTVEGFPNTFVQAAMGATPVLSLNVNPDDVLTANGFGRVAGGDEERLRHDLGELLGDEELRTTMGRAGFDYARRTHDIEVVIEQVKGLLRGVVGA